mgnify:FL=1
MRSTTFVLRGVVVHATLLFAFSVDAQTPDTVQSALIGYGEQDLRFTTGAVTHLESGDFNQGQVFDWNQLWQGLVPGFIATRPGSNPNEPYENRIHGLHTFLSRTQPLYVVDGVPGVDLYAVDPADIVSVDVLRDAASTAIYGGRGSAGVVLINTRQDGGAGVRATYQGQVAFESAAKRYEVLDEPAFIGSGGPDFSINSTVNTDWQSQVLQSGISQAHHLGLSAGSGKRTMMRVSLHYRNQEGILRGTGFKQYNGNMLLSQKILDDRITLSGGISMASRASNVGFPEAYRYAVIANPSSPVRSDESEFAPFGGYVEKNLFDYFNPVAIIDQNKNDALTVYTFGHLRAEAELLSGLKAGLMVAREQSRLETSEYYSKQSKFRGFSRNGLGVYGQTASGQDLLEATLNWRVQLSRLNVQLLGGYGWQQANKDGYNIQAGNIISDVLGNNSFGSFTDIQQGKINISGFQQRTNLTGYFGRAQLQWDATYFLSFGARRDGASQLGKNAKWGTFPFFSAGIEASRLLNWQLFDQLKLRIGKGVSGSVPANDVLSKQVYSPGTDIFYNGNYVPGYYLTQVANPDLGWERHSEMSYGLDFALLKNRLGGSIDMFSYTSSDLIVRAQVPVPPNEANQQYQNIGELSGKGVEIALRYDAVKQQHFTWEVGLNASKTTVRLENAGTLEDTTLAGYPGAPCGCGNFYYLNYPGAEVGTFWGPVTDGSFDANGEFVYQNLDNNPQIDPNNFNRDQTNLGSGQPKWVFGISQQIRWKRFDLSMLLRGASGHQLVQEMRLFYETFNPTMATWNNVITRYSNPESRNLIRLNSSYLEKGTFLRLQNIAIGYKVGLPAGSWVEGLHIQVGAQNLLTFTKYTGLDPDVRISDGGPTDNGSRNLPDKDVLQPGIDRRNTYPLARLFWLGIKAEF